MPKLKHAPARTTNRKNSLQPPLSRRHCAAPGVLGLLLVVACAAPQTSLALDTSRAQPTLPTVTLQAGMHLIKAEVADTPGTQQVGLMHRQSLPLNGGMLFVFNRAQTHCFWMKNTPLALSIAFIDDDGTIANIADMEPNSEESHCASRPVRFALEMAQGWFKRKGITAGSVLKAKGIFATP